MKSFFKDQDGLWLAQKKVLSRPETSEPAVPGISQWFSEQLKAAFQCLDDVLGVEQVRDRRYAWCFVFFAFFLLSIVVVAVVVFKVFLLSLYMPHPSGLS